MSTPIKPELGETPQGGVRLEPGLRERWGRQRMGRVRVPITIRNSDDLAAVRRNLISEEQVRSLTVEGLVDTGANFLCLPRSMVQRLGLVYRETLLVRTANGPVNRNLFVGAEVGIQGRSLPSAVMEIDEVMPPLIGVLVLEMLDFVVDPGGERLIPNPEHGGDWMADIY